MAEGAGAAADIASDQVGVAGFQVGGKHYVAGGDAIAEAGSEPLDLIFDAVGHVYCGAVGDMAVGPESVFAIGGASVVEEAGLHQQDVGSFADAAIVRVAFGFGDFGERAAEMDGARAMAFFCAPGNGSIERPIHFENSGAVAIFCETAAIIFGKFFAGNFQKLTRRYIAQDRAGFWKLVERFDSRAGNNFAA